MTLLIVGLVLFLGVHALTMARDTRARLIARLGEGGYKGAYSLVSLAGFVLIVWGFISYRAAGYIPVWTPPRAMAHVAMTLMLPAIVLLFVYLLPGGKMKGLVKHPMLVAVKLWALAHLLVNGDLGSMLLFGSFLAYGVIDRISLKRRGVAGPQPSGWTGNDTLALGLGIVTYLLLVFALHPVLFGVPILAAR